MKVHRVISKMLSSNSYVFGDCNEGVVVDPGADYLEILDCFNRHGFMINYIILTHAHIDHVMNMYRLKGVYDGKIVIHEADAPLLGNCMLNGSVLFGLKRTFCEPDILAKDGDTFKFGRVELELIHTPGHTPGSLCVKVENHLFTGDTLFKQGVGRTDLGAGDPDKLRASLNRLMELDDNMIVHPGHGTETTIGFERENNIYLDWC